MGYTNLIIVFSMVQIVFIGIIIAIIYFFLKRIDKIENAWLEERDKYISTILESASNNNMLNQLNESAKNIKFINEDEYLNQYKNELEFAYEESNPK